MSLYFFFFFFPLLFFLFFWVDFNIIQSGFTSIPAIPSSPFHSSLFMPSLPSSITSFLTRKYSTMIHDPNRRLIMVCRWIYPILDWHQSMAPVYYTLCFALNVTCFFAMLGISRARERYASCRIARTAYSPASTQENAPLAYASPGHFAKVESPDNSARNYGSMVQYPSLSALTAATSMKTFSSIPPIPPTASAILVGSGAM